MRYSLDCLLDILIALRCRKMLGTGSLRSEYVNRQAFRMRKKSDCQ